MLRRHFSDNSIPQRQGILRRVAFVVVCVSMVSCVSRFCVSLPAALKDSVTNYVLMLSFGFAFCIYFLTTISRIVVSPKMLH